MSMPACPVKGDKISCGLTTGQYWAHLLSWHSQIYPFQAIRKFSRYFSLPRKLEIWDWTLGKQKYPTPISQM